MKPLPKKKVNPLLKKYGLKSQSEVQYRLELNVLLRDVLLHSKLLPEFCTPPMQNNLEFEGTTGGWLRSAEVEEQYLISWRSKKVQIFEMPTGGVATMRNGKNFCYLAKKEQCLALGGQLRTLCKINDYQIYRIFPTGEVQYLHPKDGVFPEISNEGRIGVGNVSHSIGKNARIQKYATKTN
jgi:photosystem I subunit 2